MKKLIFLIVLVGIIYFIISVLTNEEQLGYQLLLDKGIVTSGDGLFAESSGTGRNLELPFAPKYYYKGMEVDNYFIDSNQCFRIINIANNDAIKVIHLGKTTNNKCEDIVSINELFIYSEENINTWKQSDILKIFEKWEQENRIFNETFDFTNYVKADWYIGAVDDSERIYNRIQTFKDHVVDEQKEVYQGLIGLISLSDYLKAVAGIQHSYAANQIPKANYLFSETSFWTLTADKNSKNRVYAVTAAKTINASLNHEGVYVDGPFENSPHSLSRIIFANDSNYMIYPVLYLKDGVKLVGKGTATNPYEIE